ncbi:MAG: hypothetical protein E6G92_02665 [Alphaproteobacteria bacterium]|nr:MAG: hypothetical protein E6G92_02665 [Alphaproteobacteria bacterium]
MPRAAVWCLILLSLPVAARGQDRATGPAAQRASGTSDFRIGQAVLREAGPALPRGLIGTVDLAERLRLGVGRFSVPELARPRNHTEPERRPADVRRRDQGIAAVGISYSF